jgi:hypothetical protein
MESSNAAVARQRTVNGQYIEEQNMVEEPVDMEKQFSVPVRENSMPFWQRFKGVGRRRVGVVESLKAILRSSCMSRSWRPTFNVVHAI